MAKKFEPESAAIGTAPLTAEDPSRQTDPGRAPDGIPGYPKDRFHPVYGKVTFANPTDELRQCVPAHNWFDTAEQADAHRTDREAQDVIHYNRRVRANGALTDGVAEYDPEVTGEAGIVRNSVAATESLKAGNAEPL